MLFSDANRLDGHTRFEASNLVIQILLPVHYYVPVCPIINLTEHAFIEAVAKANGDSLWALLVPTILVRPATPETMPALHASMSEPGPE
jgi:hypothetical protein